MKHGAHIEDYVNILNIGAIKLLPNKRSTFYKVLILKKLLL